MSLWGLIEDVRSLRQNEIDLTRTVFQHTISFDNVYLGNRTGLGGAPWTEYNYIDEIVGDRYIIHLGPGGYADATSSANISTDYQKKIRDTLIHELVHVWQGQHSLLSGLYQASSLFSQLGSILRTGSRHDAYRYTPGQDWSSYNVEQQAKIVENWFKNGLSENDQLFRYIRDNIRR